jgi:hypothetical protein
MSCKLQCRPGAEVKLNDSSSGDRAGRFLTALCGAGPFSNENQAPDLASANLNADVGGLCPNMIPAEGGAGRETG